MPGYVGEYEVSSHGSVRSLDRVIMQRSAKGRLHERRMKGQFLRLIAKKQYFQVTLGNSNWHTVHSLVALAFIGPRPKGYDVAHKDGNGANNKYTNLEYKTRRDNNLDRARTGKTKATPAMVEEARNSTLGALALSRKLGMSPTWVYAVRKGLCRVSL